jgi:hypothetical protein
LVSWKERRTLTLSVLRFLYFLSSKSIQIFHHHTEKSLATTLLKRDVPSAIEKPQQYNIKLMREVVLAKNIHKVLSGIRIYLLIEITEFQLSIYLFFQTSLFEVSTTQIVVESCLSLCKPTGGDSQATPHFVPLSGC